MSYANAVEGPISTEHLRVGNDLTKLNRRAMSQLYGMVEVDAVRLAGHRIQFTRTSDKNNESKTWVEVTNPYGNTIIQLCSLRHQQFRSVLYCQAAG